MSTLCKRLALFGLVCLLAACAHRSPVDAREPIYTDSRQASQQVQLGVVSAIDRVSAQDQLTGAGAALGGIAGAVIGRQAGASKDGRATGTFLGAVLGVLIGNEVEKQQSGLRDQVRLSIQLDQGGVRRMDIGAGAGLRVGDRVRIEDNRVTRI